MKKLFLIITIIISIFSCQKKENVTPQQVQIVNNTIRDTIYIVAHDTVYTNVANPNLVGTIWNCWKYTQTQNGVLVSQTSPNAWKYLFINTELQQDFDNNGTYEYTYPVSYGGASNSGYVSVTYTANDIKTYYISYDKNTGGLILTCYFGSNVIDTWYLK